MPTSCASRRPPDDHHSHPPVVHAHGHRVLGRERARDGSPTQDTSVAGTSQSGSIPVVVGPDGRMVSEGDALDEAQALAEHQLRSAGVRARIRSRP